MTQPPDTFWVQMGARIREVAESIGGIPQLAKAIGYSDPQVRRYINGTSHPTAEPLIEIAKAGEVLLDWLILGRGPKKAERWQANDYQASYAAQMLEEIVFIPFYDAEISKAEKTLPFRRDWLREQGIYSDRLAVVIAQGDSMEPTISEGDVLLVDTQQKEPLLDTIYIMSRDALVFAKRIQKKHDGSVVIKSDNPIYDPEIVSAKEAGSLRIVGRVVWIGRRL